MEGDLSSMVQTSLVPRTAAPSSVGDGQDQGTRCRTKEDQVQDGRHVATMVVGIRLISIGKINNPQECSKMLIETDYGVCVYVYKKAEMVILDVLQQVVEEQTPVQSSRHAAVIKQQQVASTKGVLHKSAIKVAVKRVSHESWHGMKEFIVEVVSMRQLCHPDLVQSAIASERDKYFSWSIVTYQTVAWINTYMIVARVHRIGHYQGSSFGVIVLHEDWEQIVLCQDIKADMQTTHMVRTMGYVAPELARTDQQDYPIHRCVRLWCIPSGDHLEQRPIEPDKGNNRIILLDWVVEHWHNDLITKAADMRILNRCSLD
uniref:Uncharacterized protein n=1 Tax=Oryza meridionalis TaxID=40149 RepID=A0A0E0FCJ4_9ORYZ